MRLPDTADRRDLAESNRYDDRRRSVVDRGDRNQEARRCHDRKGAPEERPYDPSKSKVRVVGPTFLPNEETSIDLKHPKGPAYQPVQN